MWYMGAGFWVEKNSPLPRVDRGLGVSVSPVDFIYRRGHAHMLEVLS